MEKRGIGRTDLFLVLLVLVGIGIIIAGYNQDMTGNAVDTEGYAIEEVEEGYFDGGETGEGGEVVPIPEEGEVLPAEETPETAPVKETPAPLTPSPAPELKTGLPETLVRKVEPETTEKSNVQILNQQVWWGVAMRPKEQIDEETWFQDIICERYQGKPQGVYGKGTRSQDKLSFKVINNDERQYKIGYTLPYSEYLANPQKTQQLVPMRVALNGRRVRDIAQCCGKDIIEPGEVLECKDCSVLLRFKEKDKYIKTHTTAVNNLELDSDYVSSQVTFVCNE